MDHTPSPPNTPPAASSFHRFVLIPDSSDSDYSHIYGKVRPTTNAGAVQGHYMTRKFPAKPMFMR